MLDSSGTWQIPGFGEMYDEGYYKEDKQHHVILKLPEYVRDLVGNGHIALELEVDTRGVEGWQENVEYSKGTRRLRKYRLYTEAKTWSDAEAHCNRESGHLVSVPSEEENKKLFYVGADGDVWLGGHDIDTKGVWQWTDGSPWRYNSWSKGYGEIGRTTNFLSSSREIWWD